MVSSLVSSAYGSSKSIGVRINTTAHVTDVDVIRRTIISTPENRKVAEGSVISPDLGKLAGWRRIRDNHATSNTRKVTPDHLNTPSETN